MPNAVPPSPFPRSIPLESIRMKLFDRVIVSVIAPEAVSVLQNLSPEKVTARVVDIDDPSSIAESARGCEVAYLVPPARNDKVEVARRLIDGVKQAGVNKCVILSSIGADAVDKVRFVCFGWGVLVWMRLSSRPLSNLAPPSSPIPSKSPRFPSSATSKPSSRKQAFSTLASSGAASTRRTSFSTSTSSTSSSSSSLLEKGRWLRWTFRTCRERL